MQRINSLDLLLSVYNQSPPTPAEVNLESYSPELVRLFEAGNSGQARFLLDSAELRYGPWEKQTSLIFVHLVLLLCEDDLPAARFLLKRSGFPKTHPGFLLFEKFWNGRIVEALEGLEAFKLASKVEEKAVELLLAKTRARQLEHVQLGYTKMGITTFAQHTGLKGKPEVVRFCAMSDGRFTLEGEFVSLKRTRALDGSFVGDQVEKLTRMILSVTAETGTPISTTNKPPSA